VDRLAVPALVCALASLLVPGGLLAVPAFYLASKAEPGSTTTAARTVATASLALWAVILIVAAVVVF